MWKINGKVYNLENYLDFHPGGRKILEACKGEDDCTAAFESYHALADKSKINKIMKKYEIDVCEKDFSFEENGFYDILSQKVRNYFYTNKKSHHGNLFWIFKSFLQIITFLFLIYNVYTSESFLIHIISGILLGNIFMQLGFCIMHDASHSAISKNYLINEFLSKLWSSFALWDDQLWRKHHSFRHHSFTGTKKDPDTIHFFPFIRKSLLEPTKKYLEINYFKKIFYLFVLVVFPGMWLGQSISYFRWIFRKNIWRIEIENYKHFYFETFLKLSSIYILFFTGRIVAALSFIISLNMTYAFFILPDHDTYETHLNSVKNLKSDWGEMQVRNSGNFLNDNILINHLFGGINYQIEHHLFPTICHVHFPEVKKIVKKTCEEFNIPYIEHPTLYSAVLSSMKNFEIISLQK